MDEFAIPNAGNLTLSRPYDPNAALLTVYASPPGECQRPIITFFADGRVEVSEFAKPSDAARQVLQALADLMPSHIRRPGVDGG